EELGVKMLGNVVKNDSTYIGIDGMVFPVKKEIDLNFYPKNADASFLRKYIGSIAKDFSGEGSGEIRLFGYWNEPTLEGKAYMRNCRFGIEFLNTYYTFSDTIYFAPDRFEINNVKLFDDKNNSGYVTAYAKHNLLKDFTYQANANFQNLLLFNANENMNSAFYGTVFGSGSGMIKGTEKEINISANVQNTDDSKITLNFMDKPEVIDHNFILFVDRDTQDDPQNNSEKQGGEQRKINPLSNSGMELNLDLKLVVNEDATIEVIMDPVSGDKISTLGRGVLDVQYGTDTPLRIFGKYTIAEGKYDFSLEQLYFLHFNIHEGSSIYFKDDPYTAELDVKAAHTVQASLSDLSTQLLDYSTRSKVPVDCVINLSGLLERPEISFDIELPGATAELERQVKSYIRTDDMMNRQILYLLVLSRFYTPPEFADADRNNDYSLLTATLSTQLSNILGSITDKVQVGTQFHHSNEGDFTSTEVELMLSSSFVDNRLIIYGNFGYIDNPYINDNNTPLVGDFDVEYKLTKNGDIRLKGFNHYNYRYYYSQSPQWTQGVGVLLRKDFDHFMDLFRKKKKVQSNETSE
ncbi:translocation/assembly module TamB, partial [Bacteroidales bacterium OttesenSCG-928-M11]|nr:translocation/assembly module TamB [Bacteroidales bacterium OttesenSCG-928-M11]